ncbi:MAG: DUF1963 domain-containing protein [Actinomycetota bacterium]
MAPWGWLRRARAEVAAHQAEQRAATAELRRRRAEFDADRQRFEALATPALAARVREACLDRSSPAIELAPAGPVSAQDPTASRFGGQPYVPAGFRLPPHPPADSPVIYTFLAQVNLAEVYAEISPWPGGLDELPQHGLLQVWALRDEEGGDAILTSGDHWTLAVWFADPDPAAHDPSNTAAPVRSSPSAPMAMAVRSTYSHADGWECPPGITDDEWIAYTHILSPPPPHQLLGTPNPQGYDPLRVHGRAGGSRRRSLLQLAPDQRLGPDWMPSLGVIIVVIEEAHLHAGDLEQAWAELTYS